MKQLQHNETPKTIIRHKITLICDGVSLSANVGAIFRLADAFGVEKVIFGGSEPNTTSRKIKHVSRSTHRWVEHIFVPNALSEIADLRAQDYLILALEITQTSKSIHQLNLNLDQKICLVLGSEKLGISESILKSCDETVHIPIYGKNSSMNVANALGIILYEITRQISR